MNRFNLFSIFSYNVSFLLLSIKQINLIIYIKFLVLFFIELFYILIVVILNAFFEKNEKSKDHPNIFKI